MKVDAEDEVVDAPGLKPRLSDEHTATPRKARGGGRKIKGRRKRTVTRCQVEVGIRTQREVDSPIVLYGAEDGTYAPRALD
jgi:hypothetical protein